LKKPWFAAFKRELTSDRNFNSGEGYGDSLGDLFANCEAILYVQADHILDVLHGFLIGIALAVAARNLDYSCYLLEKNTGCFKR
jgi:hypothetical protein